MTDYEFFQAVGGKETTRGGERAFNFGWLPFADRTSKQTTAHKAIVGAMPGFRIRGRWQLEQRRYPLWKARVQVLGGHKEYVWQSVGSCVGAAGEIMRGTLSCVEIALGGEAEEYRRCWWPFTWGRSRYYAGITGRGDGSTGSGWAKAITTDGMFEDDPDGENLPEFKETSGWLQLPGKVELDWSDGRRIAEKYVTMGRKRLVKTAALMRSADDCIAALANGHTLTQASNFGMRSMVPRPQGNPPVRLGDWDGSWSHQTPIDEYWDHPTLGEIFRWGNNWGPDAHGTPTGDEPPGGVYIRKATLDEICRRGEVYAFSAYDGFPARELNWFI